MPIVTRSGDKIRSVKLEYNLTEHCNYGCDQCNHMSPYMPRKLSRLEVFEKDLAALAKVMRVGRFRFVGGEPLLHPQLCQHVELVRDSGIADEIQVFSNGALLDRIAEDVFAAIDTLTISWYPDPRCDRAKIDRAIATCERVGTRVGVVPVKEFRLTQLTRPNDDPALVGDLFRTCEVAHSWYCQTFYEGRFYLCSRPIFTAAFLGRAGASAPDFARLDGVPLHQPGLEQRLRARLSSPRPLAACDYCLGSVGRAQAWRQLDARQRKVPAQPATEVRQMIDWRRLRVQRVARLFPLRASVLFVPERIRRLATALFSRSWMRPRAASPMPSR